MPTLGEDKIQRSVSEVHLGLKGTVQEVSILMPECKKGQRTMYAMMGSGAYGSSSVAPMVIAHLWKVFALQRMLYGLETYCLRTKDVQQLEQLQRSLMKRIQCLPIRTAASGYGLLGIRPIQQELDKRTPSLLGNVLLNKNTLEYEIAQRQLAVKSIESKSGFADCNRLFLRGKYLPILGMIISSQRFDGINVIYNSIRTFYRLVSGRLRPRVHPPCWKLI